MSTAAQIDANRINAESSTGPKTEEGKSVTRYNALKHGLSCGRVLIDGENPEELRSLKSKMRAEHAPLGITEDLLVEKIAMSLWFSRRSQIYLSAALDAAPMENPIPESQIAIMLRYQVTYDRAFYKALSTLKELQKERRKTDVAAHIGFVQKATPEALWDYAMQQEKLLHPDEPELTFTPEQKKEMIDSLK